MALVSGPLSLYSMRFLLGVAEAGFFPGVTFYLATWFPREYRTRIIAWFLVAIPGSSLIGAPLCGLLLQLDGVLGLAGWKWMFIAVSLPPIAAWFCRAARALRSPGRHLLAVAAKKRARFTPCAPPKPSISRKPVCWARSRDMRIITLAVVQFGFTLGSYGIGIWLPLIMKEYHLSNARRSVSSRRFPICLPRPGCCCGPGYVDRTGKKIVNMTLALALAAAGLARLCVFRTRCCFR